MLKLSPVISKSVVLFFISVLFINECNANDKTTCMTENGEKSDELHFVCYCINEYQEDVMKHAEVIADHPGFSLAHFAYNLAGSYFGKTVHISFKQCRHLKLILDHMELSRIGSDFFRPDIQVRGLVVEQVYHLELGRNPPRDQTSFQDEYLIAFPSESLVIELASVALVKIDAGAEFSSLQTASEAIRLYIDLNQGQVGDEDKLNILGFQLRNIFFITNTQRIRMQEGENVRDKMKELALGMSARSRTNELSFALVTFAVVIFLGIIGLGVVVTHRQKRKRQLKDLLRAKNLGPILESREIAQNTGMKHYPQYINNEKNIHIKKYSETKSRGQTPNPDIEALSPTSPSVANEDNKKIRRLDINDLLAAIMVRMRKNEATFHRKSSPTQETSFYYKESSVYSSNSKDENSGIKDVAIQVHKDHQEGSLKSSIADSISDGANSYVSRISQQVFVDPKHAKNYDIKNKFASFFSSVSASKSKYKTNNTKL